MNKKELLHRMLDLVLEMQEQGKNYCCLEISFNGARLRAIEGEFNANKDYIIREDFELKTIEGSKRFERAMIELEGLLEVEDAESI